MEIFNGAQRRDFRGILLSGTPANSNRLLVHYAKEVNHKGLGSKCTATYDICYTARSDHGKVQTVRECIQVGRHGRDAGEWCSGGVCCLRQCQKSAGTNASSCTYVPDPRLLRLLSVWVGWTFLNPTHGDFDIYRACDANTEP